MLRGYTPFRSTAATEFGFLTDDVDPESFVHGADRVEVDCGLSGITQLGFAGRDDSSEVFRCVGRPEVLDDAVLPASLISDLHGRGTRRGGYLAHEWAHSP